MDPKKKRLYVFYGIVSIPAIFLLLNLLWALYLYRRNDQSYLGNFVQFLNVSLLLSLSTIVLTFYLIDKKFDRIYEARGENKLRIKDLSKIEQFAAYLIIFGCLFVGISIFIGEYMSLFYGSNFITNIFIVIEYIGIIFLIFGSILILKKY
jgi:hypothetical protein